MALHDFLANCFRQPRPDMFGLLRADQRNNPDRAVAHLGPCGERGDFLDDNVRFDRVDLLALSARAMRHIDVDQRRIEAFMRLPESEAAAFFPDRTAWKSG